MPLRRLRKRLYAPHRIRLAALGGAVAGALLIHGRGDAADRGSMRPSSHWRETVSCPTSVPWGDANADGTTNIIDAQQLARFVVGLPIARLSAVQFAGDVNADATVNILDAQQVGRFAVGLPAASRLGTALAIPPDPASITVGPANPFLLVGDSVQLTAVALDAISNTMGACAPLTWTSADTTGATVSSTGVVRARNVGTPLISATNGGASGSTAVAVTTSAAVSAVVSGTDSTTVTTVSGSSVTVPPGALTAGTTISVADGGVNLAVNPNQVGPAVLVTIRQPAMSAIRAAAPAARAAAVAAAAAAAGEVTLSIPAAAAPQALQSGGATAVMTLPGGGSASGPLYTRDIVVVAGTGSGSSLIRVPLRGIPDSRMVLIRIDRIELSASAACDAARTLTDPDPTNAAQAVDPARTPLILIHGWQYDRTRCDDFAVARPWNPLASGNTWGALYPALRADAALMAKYQVWSMAYPTNRPIREAADYLQQQIAARFETGEVVIVAHGMGGLVAATYIGNNPASNHVAQLIALATPFRGTAVADVIAGAAPPVACPVTVAAAPAAHWAPVQWTRGVDDLRPDSPAGQRNAIVGDIALTYAAWWNRTSSYRGEFSATPATFPRPLDAFGDCLIRSGADPDNSDGLVPSRSAKDPAWGEPAQSRRFDGIGHEQLHDDLTGAVAAVIDRLRSHGTGFVSVAAGHSHTCALEAGGAASCWGRNNTLQLGDGTTTDRASPGAVSGAVSFSRLTASTAHGCGLTAAGAAYCWGDNQFGALGDGTLTDRGTPTPVTGNLLFAALAAGGENVQEYTCGVTAAGAVYCWGFSNRVVDDDTTAARNTPALVSTSTPFAALSAGHFHVCGITTSGAAYCAGKNASGQLGDGTKATRRSLIAVDGNVVFANLTAGDYHTCGLTAAGVAFCWGENAAGQVGDGTKSDRTRPTAVSGSLALSAVTAGAGHTCGLTTAGAAYCWGTNASGQLGDATTTERHSPVAVAGGLAFTSLAAGGQHTCGVTATGAAYCWGSNEFGQLGRTGTNSSVPSAVIRP